MDKKSSSIYSQHKPTGGNDLYLKLKDGDKVNLRIASEPALSVYKPGDKPRYSWVVFNRDEAKPQVYTAGISVYGQIADIVDDWGEPTKFDITIKRTGSGLQDTEYSVVPVKESTDLTDKQLEEIEKIDLIQAIKGKWLSAYIEDHQLPDPNVSGDREELSVGTDTVHEVPDDDKPISLDDIPF